MKKIFYNICDYININSNSNSNKYLCIYWDDQHLIELINEILKIKYWKTHIENIYIIKRSTYTNLKLKSELLANIYNKLHITDFIFENIINDIFEKDNLNVQKLRKILKENEMPKFDYIIQNPPYSGDLHLKFFEAGLNMLKNDGKMVIIEPSTWLIDIKLSGRNVSKYNNIKELINKHVKHVIIDNYNNEFNTGLYVPFAITYIDKGKLYNNIKCQICGENKMVKSLYDINLIGNYKTIWSILNKLLKYDDMMINHKYNKKYKYDSSIHYAKFYDILSRCGCDDPRFSDNWFINNIYTPFYHCLFDCRENISNKVIKKLKNGRTYNNPAYSNTDAANICDTKIHLENFKYNVYNTKLFSFLGMLLIIQENPTPKFTPWLVDKKYTDQEIYDKFGFTDKEIKLIETTIKKYERYSPWFKRYLCGPSSVSDEEVQKFINELENA